MLHWPTTVATVLLAAAATVASVGGTAHRLDVFITADDQWTATVNGVRSTSTGISSLNPTALSYTVNSGDILLAFSATDLGGAGSVGGLLVTVNLDGQYIAATGDSSPWMASYNLTESLPASAGWNTSLAFDDSAWTQAANLSCPVSQLWSAASPGVVVNSSPAKWVWGGASGCNTNGNSVYYRLKLTIPTDPAPVPPTGKRKLEIVLAADDIWTARVNGTFYYSYNSSSIAGTTITQAINDGPLLIAFMARDFGASAGFIANIRIDGRSVAVTGDSSNWKAQFSFNPMLDTAAGWSTDINYSTTGWQSTPSACLQWNNNWLTASKLVTADGSTPQWIWGPTCTTASNAVYYRLLLDVSDALVNPTPTPPGSQKLTVRYLSSGVPTAIINGKVYTGYNQTSLAPVTITQYVNPGQVLLAFGAYSTVSGTFAAIVLVNDVPVAMTGDASDWMAVYSLNPAAVVNTAWTTSLTYSTGSWSKVGMCTANNAQNTALLTLVSGDYAPMRIWGPTCLTNPTNQVVYYRLKINVDPAQTLPADVGTRQLTVRLAANDFWWANLGGRFYSANGVASNVGSSISRRINDGQLLIAFAIKDNSGGGSFTASVSIDGKVVAVTGDKSSWRALYTTEPGVTWNTNYAFDDSAWFSWIGTCTATSVPWATALAYVGGSTTWPAQTLWGPNCGTSGNSIYYRLRLNVSDAMLSAATPSPAPPSPNTHKVDLYMVGDDFWTVNLDGNVFTSTATGPQVSRTMSVNTTNEVILIAFSVRETFQGGGFAATVVIDGVPVAVSGDKSKWKVNYSFSPPLAASAGWDTNVNFADSTWSNYTGTCMPVIFTSSVSSLNSISVVGASPRWVWGPLCTTADDDAQYRLKINITEALLSPIQVTPSSGKNKIDVRLVGDDVWLATIAGRVYNGYNVPAQNISTITTNTSDEMVLFTFAVKDLTGGTAGFSAIISVNGNPVAVTGDTSGWKSIYSLNTADVSTAGWDSSLTYDDSAWQALPLICPVPATDKWISSMGVLSADVNPQVVWGPTCETTLGSAYFRLKLNITAAALLSTQSASNATADGSNRMDIQLTADDYWVANVAGKSFNSYKYVSLTPTSITRYVGDGVVLLSFLARSGGNGGGFAASVSINDRQVAVTGDNSDWKVSYTLNTATQAALGWDTNVNFDDSSWSSWHGSCPPYGAWAASLTALASNTTITPVPPLMTWGPQCSTLSGSVYYRLKINVTQALLAPLPVVDTLGPHRMDVRISADNVWSATLAGKVFTGYDVPSIDTVRTISRGVNDGDIALLAFRVRDYSGGGGFAATVYIDGKPVAVTGDMSGWMANYAFDAQSATSAPGWNTQLNYNDTAWTTRVGLCPPNTLWMTNLATMATDPATNLSAVAQARMIWGPSCTSTGNTVVFRLKVNVTEAVNRPIATVPDLSKKKLEVRLAANNSWTMTVNSQVFRGYGQDSPRQILSTVTSVFEGDVLISFQVNDYSAGGSFVASIFLEDKLVAATADTRNDWKAHYTFDPAAVGSMGWDSDFNYTDSAWSSWIAGCPDTRWDATISNLSTTDLSPERIWGPTCWAKQNIVHYRLKFNTLTVANPAPTANTGANRVDVVLAVKDEWMATVNGSSLSGIGLPALTATTLTRYVDDGSVLLAFRVRDFGSNGGFIASVFVNGNPVAVSGDTSAWKIAYYSPAAGGFDPSKVTSAGWNTNLQFNDAAWSPITGSCPMPIGAASVSSLVAVNGSVPAWIYGPLCSSTFTVAYMRLKLDVNATSGVVTVPSNGSGARELKVLISSYYDWTVRIGGVLYTNYAVPSGSDYRTITRFVDNGEILLAFSTRGGIADVGGLLATVLVDGQPVAVTGDTSNWSANYAMDPVAYTNAGWNTDLAFNDSSWSPVAGGCAANPSWSTAMSQVRVNGAKSNFIWDSGCSLIGSDQVVNYRLKLNIGGSYIAPLVPIPDSATAARQLKISVMGNAEWKLYFKGTMYSGAGSSVVTINRAIDNEVLLLAFYAFSSANTPGLVATVTVDDILVAYTGDRSSWRAAYGFNPNLPSSDGWNRAVNFNDGSWVSVTNACPLLVPAFNDTAKAMAIRDIAPNSIWGPKCGSTLNHVYYRLKISVTSAIIKDGASSSVLASATKSSTAAAIGTQTKSDGPNETTRTEDSSNAATPAMSGLVVLFLIVGGIVVALGITFGVYMMFCRASKRNQKKKPAERLITKSSKASDADSASINGSAYSLDYSQMAFSPAHKQAAAASANGTASSATIQSHYSTNSYEAAQITTSVNPAGGYPQMYGSDAKKTAAAQGDESYTGTVFGTQDTGDGNMYASDPKKAGGQEGTVIGTHGGYPAGSVYSPGQTDITQQSYQYPTTGTYSGAASSATVEIHPGRGTFVVGPRGVYDPSAQGSTIVDEVETRGNYVAGGAQSSNQQWPYNDGSTIVDEISVRGAPTVQMSQGSTMFDETSPRGAATHQLASQNATIIDEVEARGITQREIRPAQLASQGATIIDESETRGNSARAGASMTPQGATIIEETETRGPRGSVGVRAAADMASQGATIIDETEARGPRAAADMASQGATIIEESMSVNPNMIGLQLGGQADTIMEYQEPPGYKSGNPSMSAAAVISAYRQNEADAQSATILEEATTRDADNV